MAELDKPEICKLFCQQRNNDVLIIFLISQNSVFFVCLCEDATSTHDFMHAYLNYLLGLGTNRTFIYFSSHLMGEITWRRKWKIDWRKYFLSILAIVQHTFRTHYKHILSNPKGIQIFSLLKSDLQHRNQIMLYLI